MRKEVAGKLKEILDPELGINIVDLGLIYGIEEKEGEVKIRMTLTFPGCPLASFIEKAVVDKVFEGREIKNVQVEIVWEPAWSLEMVSEEARTQLGWFR
ncbi:MAG: hypothetical protein A2Y57_01170 [Candidatus Woykebacteria bacterium RBG_13_40_7b]|uniref:MIP18 family-like domain-containing protein n=1 Tax=Candidatus Woykebacteria bacterium RBG_13_40_7b TaxID=1802594 RepID=A0A1G1WC67_9BACT|nr:MAG: hypothetical protein A2Y57_01170 [Candidatus Woykebacteria bacterium RBG_13_40_7b]